jgi:hypothetical protein
MAKVESKLVTKRMPWHANMTELNHLGAALIAKPEVFESKFNKLFTAYQYSDNPLTSVLTSFTAGERNSTTTSWEWPLKGANTRPLVSMGNINASQTPGAGRNTFILKLDENWFVEGDILHPGTSNKRYQVRVQADPARHGSGWAYTVRLMDDTFTAAMPLAYLASGQKWAKLFSQYGEGGQKSGSTQYSLPITLQNRMSRFRKEYMVTGDAANEVLAVKIADSNGKMHNSWIKYAEVEYWQQWYKEIERGHFYSRSTDTVIGENGRPIYSGPGIQEQLEDSHIHRYSHLTATLIEEYLMDIFYSRVRPGSGRKIKAFTGEYGMLMFHRAIQAWADKSGFIKNVEIFTDKVGSPYNANALAAGYQYVKYRMANGAEMELIHCPLYDDREINFEIDPVTGFPTESMRYTFLDFSNENAGNIQIVNKTNGMALGYVAGLQTPFGPTTGNKAMAHSGDYYEMHVKKQCGIHIEDVSRCGELILSRN